MIRHLFLGIAVVLCASACSSSPDSRFYMLAPMQEAAVSAPVAADQTRVSLCVGPVLVPGYLDRLPVCVRESAHEVTFAEFHRWAESLEDGIGRVLLGNLAQLLDTARIDLFPWKSPAPADYQVRIMLIRFDGAPGEQAVLKALWSISAAGQERPVFETISAIVEPVDSGTYEALVEAQNRALERLSREIAAAIQAQQP
ncbi:MAG: membrane integrity-associated transporter subunit PqiC [Deltaproteobacteria bacterium]|nr:membrane integrity-associated transporter subunit PqiC [Deltaproteobacteria bacterium]